METNPILRLDYPDPDVIRVEDTYYMVSTTMHFMPGCEILRSYDLIHWEHASYVYEVLDSTPAQRLQDEENIYGKGMWAATFRYNKGIFYILFVANDTRKTYLYTSKQVIGPWKKQQVEGFYHDASLLFDDDDRVYVVYGNKQIFITELREDLLGPKPDGLNRMIISEDWNQMLGYEGSHIYKMNNKYYIFLIHSDPKEWKRIEACFVSDSLDGTFIGGDILNDDMGYRNQGVAQGGIVDTKDGEWYAILFQDRGAVGRIPVLVPVAWRNDYPVFGEGGKVPKEITTKSLNLQYIYQPLVGSDDFVYEIKDMEKDKLKSFWQWNHEPDPKSWFIDQKKNGYCIRTQKLAKNMTQANNTLTQRMRFPNCAAFVTVDGTKLNDGDFAGIGALQGCFGMIALTREDGKYYICMQARRATNTSLGQETENEHGIEYARIPVESSEVTLKLSVDFMNQKDEATFYYLTEDGFIQLGIVHSLYFKLDHFAGCRFALFSYSTKQYGGIARFQNFVYE